MVRTSTSIGPQSNDAAPAAKKSFNMTGQPVLIQNSIGIYYGTLERLDTRDGTALLSNGYTVSPKRHITFAQLAGITGNNTGDSTGRAIVRKDLLASDDVHDVISRIAGKVAHDEAGDTGLRLVQEVRHGELLYLAESNTITDYAIGGIAEYKTVYASGNVLDISPEVTVNTRLVPTISITGVIAVVPIDGDQIVTRFNDLEDGEDMFEEEIPVVETFKNLGKNMFSYKMPGTLSKVVFNDDGTETREPVVGHMTTVISIPTLLAVINGDEQVKLDTED